MRVEEIMTKNPQCCTPEMSLRDAAQLMRDHDCGELPVVESRQSLKIVGVITDRDITCRAVTKGGDPKTLKVEEFMTSPAVTVTPETSIDECCDLLEERRIRRIPVVDRDNRCIGMVAQADIARTCEPEKTAEVVREVSQVA